MKISDLEKALRNFREEHGDIPLADELWYPGADDYYSDDLSLGCKLVFSESDTLKSKPLCFIDSV